MKTRPLPLVAGFAASLLSALAPAAVSAAALSNPPVFTSERGSLDLVMVAKPVPTQITPDVTTPAWVYEQGCSTL